MSPDDQYVLVSRVENRIRCQAGVLNNRQVKTAGHWSQVQVTGRRSQKVRHSAGLFMFIYSFHFRLRHNQAYVWHRPCFPCSKSKRKLHIVLELEEFLLSFGCLETSKRDLVIAPREKTWNEVLRGKCFPNYRLYCNVSSRFRFVATFNKF